MKDAIGRAIKEGDVVVYGTTSGVPCLNAGEVVSTKPLRVRIVTHTEYGTKAGKEVKLGALYSAGDKLERVLVVESGGQKVDLSERKVKRWNDRTE